MTTTARATATVTAAATAAEDEDDANDSHNEDNDNDRDNKDNDKVDNNNCFYIAACRGSWPQGGAVGIGTALRREFVSGRPALATAAATTTFVVALTQFPFVLVLSFISFQ